MTKPTRYPIAILAMALTLVLAACADGNVDQAVSQLPEASDASAADTQAKPAATNPLVDSADGFLPVDEAFTVDAVSSGDDVTVIWTIAPDYYLYKHRFKIEAGGVDVTDSVFFSEGTRKTDDYFGKVEVYFHQAIAEVPGAAPDAAPTTLTIHYQGCAEAGLCYPIQTRQLSVEPS